MRTTLYVDGFNLYHLRLKRAPQYKWLNLRVLAQRLAPAPDVVTSVKYYTARVSRRIDVNAPIRQQIYFEALSTEPLIRTFLGRFLIADDKWIKLASPPDAKPAGYVWTLPAPDLVKVIKVEEKGSDVNLASHLVRDALLGNFEKALVLSNDTDLVEPIRIAVAEAGKIVNVVAPIRGTPGKAPVPSPSLRNVASNVQFVDNADLIAAQFPNPIVKANGANLYKPATWI